MAVGRSAMQAAKLLASRTPPDSAHPFFPKAANRSKPSISPKSQAGPEFALWLEGQGGGPKTFCCQVQLQPKAERCFSGAQPLPSPQMPAVRCD